MVLYFCKVCNFSTPNKYNYERHLLTKKHLLKNGISAPKNDQKNEQNEHSEPENEHLKSAFIRKQNLEKVDNAPKSAHLKCLFCSKVFNKHFNLQRHISLCRLNLAPKSSEKLPKAPKNVHTMLTGSKGNSSYICGFCGIECSKKSNLIRHNSRCKYKNQAGSNQIVGLEKELHYQQQLFKHLQHEKKIEQQLSQKEFENRLLQKDLEKEQAINQEKEKSIQIAKQTKQVIHNHTTNKTINYLNNTYGDMIAMDQFLYNLEHTVQLTQEERQKLLMSYKDSGIELFARSFSHIMKENCKRQLMKEGLPEMNLIPLYCSDGNFRSHKEKGQQGWSTCYDNQSINKMINISSDQVYQSYQKSLMIFGKQRNKVFKQIKQDNHSQKLGLLTDKKV
jgi:hypothetical protein